MGGDVFYTTVPNEDLDQDDTLTTVNFRFPGQYYDQETGLHYNWHRYYDPRLGRYITSDPIGLWVALNTYAYVDNNPLRFVDPIRLARDTITSTVEGAIARGDVQKLEELLQRGALNPTQEVLAKKGLERLTSKAGDIIAQECRGSINREFPGQFRDINTG
jgi:RHS repeat-associated protein